MKLLIFGATGGSGRELVRQALDQGHAVTAFVREPAALDERDGLSSLAGDVLDAASVERAVAGHDAVLCALGATATRPGKGRSQGTRNIVRAMERVGPQRLLCQSTIGVGDSRACCRPSTSTRSSPRSCGGRSPSTSARRRSCAHPGSGGRSSGPGR